MVGEKISRRRAMAGEIAPDENRFFANFSMKFTQPKNQMFGENRARLDGEIKTKFRPFRRHENQPEAGVMPTKNRLRNDRRFANRRPCFVKNRRKTEAAFVQENYGFYGLFRVFLILGQTFFRHRAAALGECFFARV